MSTVIDIRMWK